VKNIEKVERLESKDVEMFDQNIYFSIAV